MNNPLDDILHLIYPQACLVCERELASSDKHICSFCIEDLSYTDFDLFQEPSPMDQLFWGRVRVLSTYSHLYFKKNAAAQRILFNLKYKQHRELGLHFGKEIGKRIANNSLFSVADAIVPIPLHYKKQFIRGYNQSSLLAMGLSQVLMMPVEEKIIKRVRHTSTQTKKNRFQRWENVDSIFSVDLRIKDLGHVILIDDVITTGSTVEALIRRIHEIHPDLKISVVTLAIA